MAHSADGAHAARADLSGAARAWRETDALPPEADLANVVAFRKARAPTGAPSLEQVERPSILLKHRRSALVFAGLLALSLAVHAGLYLPFMREPDPMASIGEQVISVEILIGANHDAGLKPDQGTSEATAPPPPQAPDAPVEEKTPEPPVSEVAAADPKKVEPTPVEEPPPAMTTPAEPEPTVTPLEEIATAEPPPPEPSAIPLFAPAEPVFDVPPAPAEIQANPAPVPMPSAELHAALNPELPVEPKKIAEPVEKTPVVPPAQTKTVKPVAKPEKKPEKKVERPIAAEKRKRDENRKVATRGERNEATQNSQASRAAGGVGRGRSANDDNYRGRVQAHLQRYKPSGAGQTGSAVVSFSIGGSGGVGGVRLARSSGSGSLDALATGMVRRASPFPPPPGGRGQSFSVPVNFR